MATNTALLEVPPQKIKSNPENPRLIFHEDEMNDLLGSIREQGIKVPLAVYGEGAHYVLLDGERRWRCATKLNLPNVPVLVQSKPSKLQNLLMMFNIHNVRVDWDPLPMAMKLKQIQELMEKEGKDASIRSLAAVTGVRPAAVKRAFELLELPKEYQILLMKEGQKPRNEQKMKVDLFIEIFKSFANVERHVPEVLEKVTKKEYVRSMVDKYTDGTINNVVSYREISKIAKAEKAGVSRKQAIPTIIKLVRERKYGIDEAYSETVKSAFDAKDISTKVDSLAVKLSRIKSMRPYGIELRQSLEKLQVEISRLLKA